ncbi:MAG: hypothetical protein ACD_64C00228G0001 [uncultured bacterium]|nr:MAG: hypothetical protein ACD_64C00228G0001 [uncultured bacterium]
MRHVGTYEIIGSNKHFIPNPLPPQNPALHLNSAILELYGRAMLQIGMLNEMTDRLPNMQRFIKAYVLKEALLSSSIEGIHTSLVDVFTQPLLDTRPNKNTQLVMNYTKALDVALTMIQKENLPIANRVILKAHEILMQVGEGDHANPGHFRKQSVQVGNLIPAPAPQVPGLMSALEQFMNANETVPPLIASGLAHVQFEMIHPFLDGNGRIGRLLIVLMLIQDKLLSAPILYPSYYFKKESTEYYHRLDQVRTQGDFEGWITFYLNVIEKSCIDAHRRAKDIESLQSSLTETIGNEKLSVAQIITRQQALSILFQFPIINSTELSDQLDISYNTARQIISYFLDCGILIEENQQKRGKLFRFKSYLDVLEKEYE